MKKTFITFAISAMSYCSHAQNNIFPLSGNVGIGTISPEAGLHIAGNRGAIIGSMTGFTDSDGPRSTTQILEIGGAVAQHSNMNFGSLVLSNNQTGISNLVGMIDFLNSSLTVPDKRLAQIAANTYEAINNGTLSLRR